MNRLENNTKSREQEENEFIDLLMGRSHFDGWNLSVAQGNFCQRLEQQYQIHFIFEEHETPYGHTYYTYRGLQMLDEYSAKKLNVICEDVDIAFSTLETIYREHWPNFVDRDVIAHSILSPTNISKIRSSLGIIKRK